MSSRSAPDRHPLERRFSGEHPLRTLRYLFHGQRRPLAIATLCFVVKHSPVWIMPAITANIVDIVAQPGRHAPSELWVNALVLAVVLVQNVPLHYAYARALSRAARTMEIQLRSALVRRLQHLSIGYYARQSAGALQTKVLRDVEAVEQLTRVLFDGGLACLVNIVFALVITGLRQPWFLLFFLLTVPAAAVIVYALRRPLAARNAAFREEIERMSTRVGEMAHLLPITRAHGLESTALERVGESLERVRAAALHVDGVNAVFGALSWVTFNGFNMLCLVVSAWACVAGWLPLGAGDVVLLTTYFGLITGSVLGLVGTAPQLTRGLESIRSIGEVLQCPDLEINEGKAALAAVSGGFRFEQVSFVYPESKLAALHDFSLAVEPGETIALVGPSGAGKSTVLNLVIGFIRPTQGRILVDGRDMEAHDLRTYRRFLAVVPQESILFDGTVRENVTYGLRSVPADVVTAALRDANAWDFVARLSAGLDTPVGEKGARLSGGQKQRLAIARALIRNPRVLILDEATSALDTETEALIQEALARLMRGRTTFVVAHRLSTIRNAGRIAVLEQGRLLAIGSHETLLRAGGLYARLHARQSGVEA
ncbi:MAG TPA: ABC transporter ATP-binding protein [Opitutaceae bacterium]|nr:ABC transporter ATP-binding protein [Opitutaceae bacterium]